MKIPTFTEAKPEFHEMQYIGDGVYAWSDGYHIWLETQEGNKIALDPVVRKRTKEIIENYGA